MRVQAFFPTAVLAFTTLVTADKTGFGGVIEGKDGGLEGTVTVTDPSTIVITGFTLVDGSAPKLYWWGSKTEDISSGERISEEQIEGEHENENQVIKLGDGKTADDYEIVGLWCEQFNANFGQAKLVKDGGDTEAAEAAVSGGGNSGSSDSGSSSDSDSGSGSGAGRMGLSVAGALGAAMAVAGLMA